MKPLPLEGKSRRLLTTRYYGIVILLTAMILPLTPNKGNTRSVVEKVTATDSTPASNVVQFPRNNTEADQQHVLAAAHYSLKNGFRSSVTLSNQGPRPLEIRPVLFSFDGAALDLPVVKIDGGAVRTFVIGQWAAIGGEQFEQGSLQIIYEGKQLEFGGAVQVVDDDRSLMFDEELSEPGRSGHSSLLEGVWWLPSQKAEMRLVVTNTSKTPLTAIVSIDTQIPGTRQTEEMILAAHESRILDTGEVLAARGGLPLEVGGISIKHDGPEDALLARGLIEEASTGYSSVMEFADARNARSSKLDGAGLRLRSSGGDVLKPVAVARNVSESPVHLSGRITYTAGSGEGEQVRLPDLRLDAGETRKINLDEAANQIRSAQVITAGLEFEHTGASGSVALSVQSLSRNGNHVYRLPMVDAMAQPSSTGKYPWTIQSSLSTVAYIKNVTQQRQEYSLQVNIEPSAGSPDRSAYVIGLKTIEAGETVSYDLRRIKNEQIPDANGAIIPPDAAGGQLHWSVEGGENLTLIGRAEQADELRGISSTSACTECCPDSFHDGFCNPGIVVGAPGSRNQFQAFQRNVDCFGEVFAPFSRAPTWSTSNANVATVNATGLATGVSPGTANIQARWTAVIWDIGFDGSVCSKFFVNPSPFSRCDVVRVDISQDGTVITDSTRDVVVGQKISLTGVVDSGGGSVTNQQWMIPGTRIGDYVASLMQGSVTALDSLNSSSVNFYWVDGGSHQVQFSINVNGAAMTAKATFNVKRPSATVNTNTGSIAVRDESGTCVLRFGSPSAHGIDFNASLQLPAGVSGSTQWVQIVTTNRSLKDTSGSCFQFASAGLDTTYPYDTDSSTEDSPNIILASDETLDTIDDSYRMWLMFKPPGGIWIPLKVVGWGWSATARQAGSGCSGWTIISSSKKVVSVADTSEHPQWSRAIVNCCNYMKVTCP